ncbi:beta-glucosidase 6-like [Phragmites australis]|uniref:beta-glucosidase 6-like n=1 Tax=Phragmites australis TaxID=29695 RepID=UPI002D78326E|nr:beta-glucosidase 6-like [Phragmites australis]
MGRNGIKRSGRCSMLLRLLLLIGVALQGCIAQGGVLTRGSFPKGFVFGTASAAYQYEGAVKVDGRGQTIWDTFAHTFGKITDFSNADVAVDQYHRFEKDIQLMADMGMDAYRFSIAWSRILPNGTGQVNQAGIDHYNKLIDALLSKGIQPYVTLYHWDLPQALEDRYMGWLDRQIVDDFAAYAETCFKAFGDRVKNWITLNEPHTVAVQGYDAGLQAPGRCSVLLHLYCKSGNSVSPSIFAAFDKNGKPIGDRANSIWLYIVPSGMRSLMNYVKERYNSPPVYITENGMDDSNSPFTSIKDALKDSKRIKYHNDYLTNLAASIKEDGCDVHGYFAWSLLDNWEWAAGYSSRFGLYFVDYKDNLKRYPKSSVQWFKTLLSSS